MRSFKKLILIFNILSSVSASCVDNRCNVCENKFPILDPSLNMGKISCTDHGEYFKGCKYVDEIKPICTLTPLENQKPGDCYHYECRWQSKDNFKISVSVKEPYDTIDVHLYPDYDLSPIFSVIFMTIFITLFCSIITSDTAFVAGYAGGMLSNWDSDNSYHSSSGRC